MRWIETLPKWLQSVLEGLLGLLILMAPLMLYEIGRTAIGLYSMLLTFGFVYMYDKHQRLNRIEKAQSFIRNITSKQRSGSGIDNQLHHTSEITFQLDRLDLGEYSFTTKEKKIRRDVLSVLCENLVHQFCFSTYTCEFDRVNEQEFFFDELDSCIRIWSSIHGLEQLYCKLKRMNTDYFAIHHSKMYPAYNLDTILSYNQLELELVILKLSLACSVFCEETGASISHKAISTIQEEIDQHIINHNL